MSTKKNQHEHVKREILENQILAVLSDKSKVAVVLDAERLDTVIWAMKQAPSNETIQSLIEGLEELQDAAFEGLQ